jgi:hypothetical protein
VNLEHAEQVLEAARREHERLAQQREQVAKSIRGIGHAYHCVDLERGVRRNGPLIASDIQGHIDQIRTIAQHAGLSQSCLERIDKAAARAFTGWTLAPTLPLQPYGRFDWAFEYRPDLHDESSKTFLGETGPWNGEDIIALIVKQPATAQFIARHLYNFFVADEPPVPAWPSVPPRDPEAVELLADTYMTSRYDLRAVLRTLFLSDFFCAETTYLAKVKSPTELVIGTVRLTKDVPFPQLGLREMALECRYMGQDLLNPPSVEGWHTGKEWIDTGCLVERINFAAQQIADVRTPGVQLIMDRLRAASPLSPECCVDICLDLVGPLNVRQTTRAALIDHVSPGGELCFTPEAAQVTSQRVSELLQLIVSSREYQCN